jgi:hypothetical protein
VKWIAIALFFFASFCATAITAQNRSNDGPRNDGPKKEIGVLDGAQNSAAQSATSETELTTLIQTLDNAYNNAVKRDTANPDSAASDLLLENASIQLSSRILFEVTIGSCRLDESGSDDSGKDEGDAAGRCALNDDSVDLKDLTDLLSNAANYLQRLGSTTSSDNSANTPALARIRSMEHLYRMTFAFSKAYLDRSQSGVYFQAAREELRIARQQIQTEQGLLDHDIGGRNSEGYGAQLLELSNIDERLSQINTGHSQQ